MLFGRFWIADYSLKRAKERVSLQKAQSQIPEIDRTAKVQESYRYLRVLMFLRFFKKKKLKFHQFRPLLIIPVRSETLDLCRIADSVQILKW